MQCPTCKTRPIWRAVKVISVERRGNVAEVRIIVAQCSKCGARYVLRSIRGDRVWLWRISEEVEYPRKEGSRVTG